jgi:hypothetical protein
LIFLSSSICFAASTLATDIRFHDIVFQISPGLCLCYSVSLD